MGPVFRGEDSETRRPVVIKVIRVGLTPERVAVVGPALRALKERQVAHPALNPILETGIVDIEPFVVSPVVEGDSLDVALREYGPANMADALPRLRLLADALDAAAAIDVAHGSLHLRDILVSVESTMLTGVGLAAVLERVGVRPPVRRPYCAPEVALGRGISPAGDQYSLAAIAHEWLSGRRISGPDGVHVSTSSPEGAEALTAVFGRAMAPEAGDRYPSSTAFVEALADVADLVTPRTKTSRRKPAVAAPLLEFEQADDPPALTFDTPAVTLGSPVDELMVTAGTATAAFDDVHDHDLPLVAGPRQLGEPADVVELARDEVVEPYHAARTAQLPYAAASDPADPSDDTDDTVAPARGANDDVDLPVSPGGLPSWAKWAAALAAGVLVFALGGRALLRWGTPSGAPAVATAGADAATASSPRPTAFQAGPSAPAVKASAPAPPTSRPPSDVPVPVAEPIGAVVVSAPSRAVAAAVPTSVPTSPAPAPGPQRKAAPPVAARPAPRPAPSTPAPASRPATPARAATPAVPGRLLVRSTPSGAEVFLNGERRGVSPMAVRDLALGAYTVRVVRPGFEPSQQRVVLEAGRPARALEVVLARTGAPATAPAAAAASPSTATTGSLLIESRPSGAQAFVDGVEVGRTPVTVPAATSGARAVRIQLPGYLIISTTARVEPGARARVAVTLTAERPR